MNNLNGNIQGIHSSSLTHIPSVLLSHCPVPRSTGTREYWLHRATFTPSGAIGGSRLTRRHVILATACISLQFA